MEKIMTIKTFIHLVCPRCFYDIADNPAGMDSVVPDALFTFVADDLHTYRLRSIKQPKCDWDNHMYVANL